MTAKSVKKLIGDGFALPKYLFIFDDMLGSSEFNRGSRLGKFAMHSW